MEIEKSCVVDPQFRSNSVRVFKAKRFLVNNDNNEPIVNQFLTKIRYNDVSEFRTNFKLTKTVHFITERNQFLSSRQFK